MSIRLQRQIPYVVLIFLAISAEAIELEGDFVQGGLLVGSSQVDQTISYLGKVLPTDSKGRFIVALDRDAGAELVLQVEAGERTEMYRYAIARRDYNIQHINGVANKYVAPDKAQVERARREAVQVAKARSFQRPQNDFFEGFVWPLMGPISGVFGSQRVYNGVPKRPHYGVDIVQPMGTPVKAPAAGVITMAAKDLYYSGGTVILDHGLGLSSTFLHLSALHVNEGDEVQQGQTIAEVGSTGRSTGAHLDWRMNWVLSDHSVRLDPQLLVPAMADVLKDD